MELCRFFYDRARLTELSDEEAVEMAGRLRLARIQGVSDDKLASIARKGLAMGDRPRAQQAAWLSLRAADDSGGSPAA